MSQKIPAQKTGPLEIPSPTPSPTYVQIEPVGQCNLACKMCPINFRDDAPLHGRVKMMDFDLYRRIVDGFPNLKTLHLQGLGEPTLHPRFPEMIAYGVLKGARVTTNTNLTLINQKRAEQMIESGLDTLHFSIDGTTAEVYESIRINAHFDKVMRNLETLVETKARLGSPLPHLHMVMVIMRQNLHQLPDLVHLAGQFGAEEVFAQQLSHDFGDPAYNPKFQPLNAYVHEQSLLYEDPGRIESYFGEARKRAQETGITLRLPRPRPKPYSIDVPGRERCSWPWDSAYISFQGYAMPCCMASSPDVFNLGLINGDNFNEIWDGPAYQQFRKELDSPHPPEICKSCSIYNGNF